MSNIPYSLRLGALVLLGATMVTYDRLYRKRRGEREWEYGFLFLMGLLGALYGAACDAVTSGLSPAYFAVGKGLEGTGTIKHQAMVLGAQAGFSGAVVGCAIWQFALRVLQARKRCGVILRYCWVPFSLATLLGILLPVVCRGMDPFGFAERLRSVVSAEYVPGFLTVWWVHLGVYAGLTAGVAVGIYVTRKRLLTCG